MAVEILNVIDDHSRLAAASADPRTFKAAYLVTVFRAAAAAHGLPASMLSDGAVFTGKPRGHSRVALEIELAALNLSFRHSRACHPPACGKVERPSCSAAAHLWCGRIARFKARWSRQNW